MRLACAKDWEDTRKDGPFLDLVAAVLRLDVLQRHRSFAVAAFERLQRPLLLLNFVSAASSAALSHSEESTLFMSGSLIL